MRRWSWLSVATFVASVAMALCTCAERATAQRCDSVSSRTSLAGMTGRTVRSVRIETREPPALPLLPALLDHLHVRTRTATIRRLMLIAAGDTVDTLRVAESLRRLRQLRYLGDAVVVATACGDAPVDVVVITQDLWSVRPSLQVRSASQALTLTERNVFGTGREATVGLKSDINGIVVSAALHDPWFLGRDLSLSINTAGDLERGAQSVIVQKREHSIADPVGLEAYASNSAFNADPFDTSRVNGLGVDALHRIIGGALVSRRVDMSRSAVTHISGGAEYDRIEWETVLDGARLPLREFAGLDAGARRRSVAYDTLTWVLPGHALVDVPLAFEYDALLGFGRDFSTAAPAMHVDLWAGKMWLPGHHSLLVADAWASGFRSAGQWSAATVRGALNYEHDAWRGVWNFRIGGERWANADPDLRMAVTTDPTYRALGDMARKSPDAATASLERDVHVRRLTRSYTLDAALFGAASTRPTAQVGIVGLGVRLAPARLGRATARLDVGAPVLRSGDVRRGIYVAIGITPWLEQDRQRSGRR